MAVVTEAALRLHGRRLPRRTSSFSEKVQNFMAAVPLPCGDYSFVRLRFRVDFRRVG